MARHALTQVTFWESLTGSRYRHDVGPDAPSALKYGRLGCLFNHESFYANVQVVPGCSLVICAVCGRMCGLQALASLALPCRSSHQHMPGVARSRDISCVQCVWHALWGGMQQLG